MHSVVQDSETMATPPLIPIFYLEAVGAIIDVANNQYTTTDGYSAPLRRLPSGHRAINMLAFHMTPWVLPRAQRVNGRDPFQLDPEVAEHPPSPPSSPDGPPSSQRFSKGSKSRGGPRSYREFRSDPLLQLQHHQDHPEFWLHSFMHQKLLWSWKKWSRWS